MEKLEFKGSLRQMQDYYKVHTSNFYYTDGIWKAKFCDTPYARKITFGVLKTRWLLKK